MCVVGDSPRVSLELIDSKGPGLFVKVTDYCGILVEGQTRRILTSET